MSNTNTIQAGERTLKIDWNEDSKSNARLSVSDGVMTHYIGGHQLPDEFSLFDVAQAFTNGYDHNGTEDTFAVCYIEDLSDGESHRFAFDGHGEFEWNTRRQG